MLDAIEKTAKKNVKLKNVNTITLLTINTTINSKLNKIIISVSMTVSTPSVAVSER